MVTCAAVLVSYWIRGAHIIHDTLEPGYLYANSLLGIISTTQPIFGIQICET
jgi:hypothetical protein